MKIVVTSTGATLDAAMSPVFGRCPSYVFVDTETLEFEGLSNPAVGAAGGAGIQAAQFIAQRGVDAVVTGNVGPNAYGVLNSAGISVYLCRQGGTVRHAVESFKAGTLEQVGGSTVPGHFGTGGGVGRGMGRGMGRNR